MKYQGILRPVSARCSKRLRGFARTMERFEKCKVREARV